MSLNKISKPTLVIVLMLALMLVVVPIAVTGCGEDESAGKGEITIGWIAWDECVANSYLWKNILEDQGYTVTLTQVDAGVAYAGLAEGDIDIFLDAWLPNTQKGYWDEFGDQIEVLGTINSNATLSLAVPAYVEIDSIEDMVGNADLFDGVITGIEPGAGMMGLLADTLMPGYGLDADYELLESSTPAMLAALQAAIADEEPIVVTLWRPHWIYGAEDLKDLDDPLGLWGDTDNVQALGRTGFAADFPEVAEWLGNFTETDDQIAAISKIVIEEYGVGEEEAAIEAWLSDPDNENLVESWLGM